ncbi:MAG: RteC domain-containing protein [Prolixibacteraceae bacterium]|jgi:hypothetical protein|nr:RteC domain-containing protein [Prolixibacteraceae bacterium]
MKTYCQIATELEHELSGIGENPEEFPKQIDFAVGCCKLALDRLHDLVIKKGFPDKASEIMFFKKIKPSVCSKLIYYQTVFDIESVRLELDQKSLRKYFQRELKKIQKYMKKQQIKVQYYRCGHSHLDEKYFLRDAKEIPLELKDSQAMMAEDFFTWHDHTFSVIMSNEMLIEYIKDEMEKLDHPQGQNFPKLKLRWTGDKIDLQELIYSLYLEGSVNHGKATIIDIAKAFEWIFNIDLQKNIYKTQDQLLKRSDPVKYLARLIDVLRRRINIKLK